METTRRLPIALFLLRLSVFTVMTFWTMDKFINPGHAAKGVPSWACYCPFWKCSHCL